MTLDDDLPDAIDIAAGEVDVAAPTAADPVQINAVITPDAAAAADDVTLIAKVRVQPGWHVYAKVPDDQPFVPLAIGVKLSGGFLAAGELRKPKPQPYRASPGVSVYQGDLVFSQRLGIRPEAFTRQHAKVVVRYQACDARMCLRPEAREFETSVRIRGSMEELLFIPPYWQERGFPEPNAALETALNGGFGAANAERCPEFGVEHLLLALSRDPESAEVLENAGCDVARLRADLAQMIAAAECIAAGDRIQATQVSREVSQVLDGAAHEVMSNDGKVISGRGVLVAMFKGKASPAVQLLRGQGVTREALAERFSSWRDHPAANA